MKATVEGILYQVDKLCQAYSGSESDDEGMVRIPKDMLSSLNDIFLEYKRHSDMSDEHRKLEGSPNWMSNKTLRVNELVHKLSVFGPHLDVRCRENVDSRYNITDVRFNGQFTVELMINKNG